MKNLAKALLIFAIFSITATLLVPTTNVFGSSMIVFYNIGVGYFTIRYLEQTK